MRTETRIYTIYKFDELEETAKETALNKLWDLNVDYEWWDGIYEDAENVGIKIVGFELDYAYCKIQAIEDLTNVADKIVNNHGRECETYKHAKEFLNQYNILIEKDQDGEIDEFDFANTYEHLEEDFLQSLKNDYLDMLKKDYEYLTSKEAIIESIQSNEYEFFADGNLYN